MTPQPELLTIPIRVVKIGDFLTLVFHEVPLLYSLRLGHLSDRPECSHEAVYSWCERSLEHPDMLVSSRLTRITSSHTLLWLEVYEAGAMLYSVELAYDIPLGALEVCEESEAYHNGHTDPFDFVFFPYQLHHVLAGGDLESSL